MSILSKTTIQRLCHDIHTIHNDSSLQTNGIYYKHDEDDMLKGYALIIGTENTPYFAGNYFFEFSFPANYPYSPPHVTFLTTSVERIRFHPNLYSSGKVCLSILNTWAGEQWSACQSISSVLLTICMSLHKDPLLNEPGITIKHADFEAYNQLVTFKNIDIAVCKIVKQDKSIYKPKVMSLFNEIVQQKYLENREKLVAFVEEKMIQYPETFYITIDMYAMIHIPMNYEDLRKRL
jgi:ubiquitin-protein ligase